MITVISVTLFAYLIYAVVSIVSAILGMQHANNLSDEHFYMIKARYYIMTASVAIVTLVIIGLTR